MELDFDKEIDALLRKARSDTGTFAAVAASPHLDADELTAFAENALPEKAKQLYMVHLADCDRCRTILSNTVLLNSEAEPLAASAVSAPLVTEQTVSWYRKLFLFPNLAYVMGSLVVLFSGFLVYSVLYKSEMRSSEISQMEDSRPAAHGPNAGDDTMFANSNAAAKTSAANAASNTAMTQSPSAVANAVAPNPTSAPMAGRSLPTDEKAAEPNKDTTADAIIPTMPPPAPVTSAPPPRSENEVNAPAQEDKDKASNLSIIRETASGGAVGKGPSRNERNMNRSNAEDKMMAKRAQKPEAYGSAVMRKQVSGKSFDRKEGVWYDTAYSGQATTNVRRGTNEYKNLDSGLRAIGDSLDGTVVTVWKGKAFRIQ